jgi:hypothetical protein
MYAWYVCVVIADGDDGDVRVCVCVGGGGGGGQHTTKMQRAYGANYAPDRQERLWSKMKSVVQVNIR